MVVLDFASTTSDPMLKNIGGIQMEPTLSIVIPIYNEVASLKELLQQVVDVEIGMKKELILVDDFSTDGTRDILQELKLPKKIPAEYASTSQNPRCLQMKTLPLIARGRNLLIL